MTVRGCALGLVTILAGAATVAGSARACSDGRYVYAGLAGATRVAGVEARITPARGSFAVVAGHVAGWVGVGGPGQGVGGKDEWLQVGFSSVPGTSGHDLYYEVAEPGSTPRYTRLRRHSSADASARVGVLELPDRPNWWRVWVDGAAATPPIYLPASDRRWQPIATAESWDGGTPACNAFAYRFADVRIALGPGAAWTPLTVSTTIHNRATTVDRADSGFFASAG